LIFKKKIKIKLEQSKVKIINLMILNKSSNK